MGFLEVYLGIELSGEIRPLETFGHSKYLCQYPIIPFEIYDGIADKLNM